MYLKSICEIHLDSGARKNATITRKHRTIHDNGGKAQEKIELCVNYRVRILLKYSESIMQKQE